MTAHPSLPSAAQRPAFRVWPAALAFILLAFAPLAPAAELSLTISSPNASALFPREYPAGATVTFQLANPSAVSASAKFQWLHDEQPLAGAIQSSFALSGLTAADAGNYRLRVTDGTTVTYSTTEPINVVPVPVGPVDPTFSAQLPTGANGQSIGQFAADGSMIAVYSTLPTGAVATARLAADGSLVSDFTFPASAGTVLASFPDGRLLTTGAPYQLAANGTAIAFTLPAPFDATKPLTAAHVAADGTFYLAQGSTLARFLADGTPDTTFTFSLALETGISWLTLDRSGRLYVKGTRTDPNPYNFPRTWAVVYRLLADGQLDPSFATQSAYPLLNGSLQVEPLDDGRIFYRSHYHGYYTWRILRDDGTADPAWSGGVFTERPVVVDRTRHYAYITNSAAKLTRYLLGATGLTEDPTFYAGTTAVYSYVQTLQPDGDLLLAGGFTQWEGHATRGFVRLLTDVTAPVLPPVVAVTASSLAPQRGANVTLSPGAVAGTGPFNYQWLALDGQPLPSVTTAPQLTLTNLATPQLGRYQLRVTGPGASVLSNVVTLILDDTHLPYLANLSGRAAPGTGENTAIAGFTVGSGPIIDLLLRGVGPGLKPLGVTDYLTNPALNLFTSTGTLANNNGDWGDSPDRDKIRAAAVTSGAFALAEGSLDAALIKSVGQSQFTLQLFDQAAATGAGLIEIYRVPDDSATGQGGLINLSLRAHTGMGDAIAIAGFVLVDPQGFGRSAHVLLRVVGPTLSTLGIQHPLTDPVLTLYNAQGDVVTRVDDWPSHLTTEVTAYDAATTAVGAFQLPQGSKDAGVLIDLPAGAYTLTASGADGGSGVVLLEIYLVR